MRKKNRIGLWIFTLGVLMLLLRPYMVYQMTSARARQGDPARAWSLLQRLVKKKDDHHEQEALGVTVLSETTRSVTGRVLRLLNAVFYLLAACTAFNLIPPFSDSKVLLPVRRQRYRLSCCFLI